MDAGVPRVSVCISTYNRSRYLRQAIESVLAQTFTDFELIVSDDCSPDDTAAVVGEYRDPRLRYSRNSDNLGLVGNYNRCLELARGEYVGIFDDDDMYMPAMLESTVAALDAHPDAAFVCGAAVEIDDNGRPVGMRRSLIGDVVLHPSAAFAHLLIPHHVPPQPTTLVRAAAFARVGPYDPQVGAFANDADMWLRLASEYPVVYLDQPLARYRLTNASETKRGEVDGSNAVSLRTAIAKALAAPPGGTRPPLHIVRRAKRAAARYELSIAYGMLTRGDLSRFRRHTRAALALAPELIVFPAGLTTAVLAVASLAGVRGPQLLWRTRDLALDARGSLTRVAESRGALRGRFG